MQNGVIHPLASAPTSSKEGQIYYNTTENNIYRYTGTQWVAYTPALIPFGTVNSTSTSTVFTATVPGVTELKDGVCVLLRNSIVTSASGFTINVNDLGAKPCYNNMSTGNPTTPTDPTRDTTIFNINYTMLFIYSESLVSGGCWICYRGYDANTNTIGYQLRTNSMSLPMKQITYRYRLLFMSADNLGWVPANTSTSTNATAKRDVNQAKINPFGPIVYYGTPTSVAAGSRPSVSQLWQQYTITLGYSFNRTGAALTLTAWEPVYIKCTPQSDGSAIIDADNPYVQTLPSTADGKIYIYLGVAYAATTVEMTYNHPIYEFKDGAIREWTNGKTSWNDLLDKPSVPTIASTTSLLKGDNNGNAIAATAGDDYQAPLPSQAGNSGKYLTTNGSVLSWASPPGAPVTSVNTKTGDVVLTAADVGAATSSDISTAINALDGSITGTAGAGKTFTAFSQTNGKVTATFGDISITKSQISDFPTIPGGSSTSPKMDGTATVGTETTWARGDHIHPSDTNKQNKITASGILKGNGSGTITAATAGTDYQAPLTAGTDYATPSQIPNVPSWAMESTKPTYTATEVGAAPLNESNKIDPAYLPSYVDDVIEGYYNSTDGKFYEEDTYTTEITPEAGKIYIDLSTNKSYRWGGTTYVEMPTGSTVTVSQGLSSGTTVGTITIDGTTTTLYAPTDTDTKVTQTKATYSSYTYWRAVPVGALSVSTPTGAFGTSATTDREYSFDNLRFWPQYGWIRTHAFNPAPTAANTTASYNNMTSDSINNIYFRINATAYNNGDTVMTLYSNGTDMQVRPGGQYDDMVDLGKSTVRWKDLYLSGIAKIDDSIELQNSSSIGFNYQIVGYYNSTDGKFYMESTFVEEIAGQLGKEYIDRPTNNSYYWNGTSFVLSNDKYFFGPRISSSNQLQLNLYGSNTVGTLSDVTVRGVATPTNNNDAANKSYVDSILPAVTSSDNGKVLAVVNGAWAAVELSSLLTIYNGETS